MSNGISPAATNHDSANGHVSNGLVSNGFVSNGLVSNGLTPKKPIFLATHPRSCSTAFERVMLTRPDTLHCIHEPFGDAFYYGPERLGTRFLDDPQARKASGFSATTFADITARIDREAAEHPDKTVFIKDMAYYLIPPSPIPFPPYTPPTTNPTILPTLDSYTFTFLIRDPLDAIPSYYRCTRPPLKDLTGFTYFDPAEAGYRELRALFDYIRTLHPSGPTPFVLDAKDLLEQPARAVKAYCEHVGTEFKESMLEWGSQEVGAFEKWKGFHEDAMKSSGLKGGARPEKSIEQREKEWEEKWGVKAREEIKSAVEQCKEDYEYLRSFSVRFDKA